jgi:hypothetical protein
MPRPFNVYSPIIVVTANETFDWVVNASELRGGAEYVTVNVPQLSPTPYKVKPGTPTPATVPPTANGILTFSCDPPATNVTRQQIVIAAVAFVDPCAEITLTPGDYFVWKNGKTDQAVTITPDPSNTSFWPIEGHDHAIAAGGHHAVQISPYAILNQEYGLVVTYADGSGCVGTKDTGQPKIIVGSGGGGVGSGRY